MKLDDYELDFKISVRDVNLIIAALEELPARLCNPVVSKLKAAADPQLSALQKVATNKNGVIEVDVDKL